MIVTAKISSIPGIVSKNVNSLPNLIWKCTSFSMSLILFAKKWITAILFWAANTRWRSQTNSRQLLAQVSWSRGLTSGCQDSYLSCFERSKYELSYASQRQVFCLRDPLQAAPPSDKYNPQAIYWNAVIGMLVWKNHIYSQLAISWPPNPSNFPLTYTCANINCLETFMPELFPSITQVSLPFKQMHSKTISKAPNCNVLPPKLLSAIVTLRSFREDVFQRKWVH